MRASSRAVFRAVAAAIIAVLAAAGLASASVASSGAVIKGLVTASSSGASFDDAYAVLATWSGEYVESVDVDPIDHTYEFSGVANGKYKVWVDGVDGDMGAWAKKSSAVAPQAISVSAGQTVTAKDAHISGDETTIVGQAMPKSTWSTSQLCVAAVALNGDVDAVDCLAPGELFHLAGLQPRRNYTIIVAPQQLLTESAWHSYSGARYLWGSYSNGDYLYFPTPAKADSYRIDLAHFTDVDGDSSGFDAISWMGATEISTGFDDGSYRPTANVTRRQMAFFMYRMAGEPSFPLPTSSPYTDVKKGDPGYVAIAWLDYAGVATGFDDGSYRPLEPVTRRQMAFFMYRYAGSPSYSAPKSSPYTDVKKSSSGYRAIAWMGVNDIATGFDDGSYRPLANVTRRQMAFFMYRFWTGS